MKNIFILLSYIITFMLGGVCFYLLGPWYFHATELSVSQHDVTDTAKPQVHSHSNNSIAAVKTNPSISKDSKAIFHDDDSLLAYLTQYGLRQTIVQLNQLGMEFGDCHQPAHKAGRFAYQIFSAKAFYTAGSECHSGGLHGVIEAYFKENGIQNIAKDVNVICSSELNPFFGHQCIHGIGHGLMAWSGYKIHDSLSYCDNLPRLQASCYSGVFMENIVGGLAHHHSDHGASEAQHSRAISDDPHYPCNSIDDKYKSACYFYQTSRMVQLFNWDFSKVAAACSEIPKNYQITCFKSMGRDIGGVHRGNHVAAINACAAAQKGQPRIHCLTGAVQDTFWDPGGQDKALMFCKTLEDMAEKGPCYKTVFDRATQVLASKPDLTTFCSKTEMRYATLAFVP